MHTRTKPTLRPIACALSLLLASGQLNAADAAKDAEEEQPKQPLDLRLPVIELEDTTIEDDLLMSKDEVGHDDVYRKDVSNVYAGRKELERYKGASVSDVFAGMNGVYSGDSRNSGALDPNIRGIQGEGRVPVTVDGTEQAISVWQGSGGVSNRNYIDPNMIGSISVEKGPSATDGMKTGVGGSVQIKTLDAEDIVKPGESHGIEIKTETASNAVAPDESGTRLFGTDYRDIEGAFNTYYGNVGFALPNGGRITPRKGSGGSDFNFEDNAFRIAAATRQENFDLLAAYSYRSKGNYYSGKGGSQRYETEDWLDKARAEDNASVPGAGTSYVAQLYHPGYEVTNTSTDIRTTLLKGTFYLPNQQSLKLSYMHSDMEFGESSPFVISYTTFRGLDGTLNVGLQSPFSEVKQDTYGLNYTWKPDDNALIDLQAGIWMTRHDSIRHQTGDSVYGVGANESARDIAWDNYVTCKYDYNPVNCANVPTTAPDRLDNSDGRYNLIAKAMQLSNHDRWGVNLSNRMLLTDTLSLTLSGDFSHEKLEERNNADGLMVNEIIWAATHMGPRSGTRQQYNFSFNNEWMAMPWMVISAGARFSDYNSFDDGLAKHRENKENNWQALPTITGRTLSYRRLMTDEEAASLEGDLRDMYASWGFTPEEAEPEIQDALAGYKVDGVYYTYKESFVVPYDGFKIDRSANQFLNGTIDLNETVENAQGTTGTVKRYISPTIDTTIYRNPTEEEKWAKPKKRRDNAWTPMFGVTFMLTDYARVYARYSELVRFPTLYEDTQAGTAFGRSTDNTMDPEHAYNWEVGYVHDLLGFLPDWRHADVRINYYENEIRNYIDRDKSWSIVQFDKKTYSGIELQARADTGRYFSNFGLSYRLSQKLCDKDYAATLDPIYNAAISSCVTGGFPATFARTSLQPKFSINLDTGVRLFNEKLELGGRMVYHSSAENKEEADWIRNSQLAADAFGRPYRWQPIWVFDAFASYKVMANLDLDFGINNITNRYYIDPLARAMLPAPGRTMKAGFTLRF
ncbi:TonB-dependent receptor [Pseudomonas sp. ABC1]|uniref:TonB-dependent receptor domain-containing protein n=1 Tax=Pseudomonas sp. ABC1 TaxID=2748080 RepID=UPI0015C2CFA8|nr:TonB-dependent receptor [Pseudomonas sp. ABC1]QLF91700.1 TonB-dependent receptor [Pseudomonas sp. ABC1]